MSTAIVWFRKSLRLDDNPALSHACSEKSITSVLPLFIVDADIVGSNFEKYHANRLRFLLESLEDLDENLKSKYASKLFVLYGKPTEIFDQLFKESGSTISLSSSDYCSEPHGRSLSFEIEKKISLHSPSTDVVFHPSVQTVLDIEEVTMDPAFKEPKSMKEIEKIFLSKFGLDDSGLFSLPKPLPPPLKILPLLHPLNPFAPPFHLIMEFSLRKHSGSVLLMENSCPNLLRLLISRAVKVRHSTDFVSRLKVNQISSTRSKTKDFFHQPTR